jgi:hypothetical protein
MKKITDAILAKKAGVAAAGDKPEKGEKAEKSKG